MLAQARIPKALWLAVGAASTVLVPAVSRAACDVIPGTTSLYRNAVILASDCAAIAPEVSACDAALSGTATCVQAPPNNLAIVTRDTGAGPEDQLLFRFPDTDDRVGTPTDDQTLAGTATIAVTAPGGTLPCADLATNRCADATTPGLIACIDEYYAIDRTCDRDAARRHHVQVHVDGVPACHGMSYDAGTIPQVHVVKRRSDESPIGVWKIKRTGP